MKLLGMRHGMKSTLRLLERGVGGRDERRAQAWGELVREESMQQPCSGFKALVHTHRGLWS